MSALTACFRFALPTLLLSLLLLPGLAQALELSSQLGAADSAAQAAEAVQPGLLLQIAGTLGDTEPALVEERVLSEAMMMLGVSYQLGRNGDDDATDCSGLVRRIFGTVGLQLPRSTQDMIKTGQAVQHAEPRKGDLLFYRWERRYLHVAVYADDGYIIHASPAAGRVVVTQITDDWKRRLVAVRRVI